MKIPSKYNKKESVLILIFQYSALSNDWTPGKVEIHNKSTVVKKWTLTRCSWKKLTCKFDVKTIRFLIKKLPIIFLYLIARARTIEFA